MSKELSLEGKFLSARALRLNEDQRCGLIKTLALLEAGLIGPGRYEHTGGFDMAVWGGDCGSVCCLGGTAEAVMGDKIFHDPHKSGRWHPALRPKTRVGKLPEIYNLFFPMSLKTNPYNASTKQAALALRGFLETGKTDWDKAMRGGRK